MTPEFNHKRRRELQKCRKRCSELLPGLIRGGNKINIKKIDDIYQTYYQSTLVKTGEVLRTSKNGKIEYACHLTKMEILFNLSTAERTRTVGRPTMIHNQTERNICTNTTIRLSGNRTRNRRCASVY